MYVVCEEQRDGYLFAHKVFENYQEAVGYAYLSALEDIDDWKNSEYTLKDFEHLSPMEGDSGWMISYLMNSDTGGEIRMNWYVMRLIDEKG